MTAPRLFRVVATLTDGSTFAFTNQSATEAVKCLARFTAHDGDGLTFMPSDGSGMVFYPWARVASCAVEKP
jgi:hypothetical protein